MDKNLYSKSLTREIYERVKKKIGSSNEKPVLAIIIVGDKKDSMTYIKLKRKKCEELGIDSYLYSFSEKVSVDHIIKSIRALNNYKFISGVLVQLPLPRNFNEQDEYNILNTIDPEKDVDGFHHHNMGKLMVNKPYMLPCTAEGCFKLLKHHKIDILGKHIVIIGCSKVVGLPLSLLLLHSGATTTLCNIHTENIKSITQTADILISCCGKPHLIDSTWIKEDSIIIDVGINHTEDGIVGDVNYDDVLQKVKYITPVPGCIGPLTIAILIEHLVKDF
jgi:methylenetetrahydrofolate dehydrogenase (NADP+) / methenyltetrahydrofolate cyclohydrolase|tara:strand:- start:441 stop:1271 length:831 start_codon:yes stop_codon:yes gene_type:complete